jgi:hypothetical protein
VRQRHAPPSIGYERNRAPNLSRFAMPIKNCSESMYYPTNCDGISGVRYMLWLVAEIEVKSRDVQCPGLKKDKKLIKNNYLYVFWMKRSSTVGGQ